MAVSARRTGPAPSDGVEAVYGEPLQGRSEGAARGRWGRRRSQRLGSRKGDIPPQSLRPWTLLGRRFDYTSSRLRAKEVWVLAPRERGRFIEAGGRAAGFCVAQVVGLRYGGLRRVEEASTHQNHLGEVLIPPHRDPAVVLPFHPQHRAAFDEGGTEFALRVHQPLGQHLTGDRLHPRDALSH